MVSLRSRSLSSLSIVVLVFFLPLTFPSQPHRFFLHVHAAPALISAPALTPSTRLRVPAVARHELQRSANAPRNPNGCFTRMDKVPRDYDMCKAEPCFVFLQDDMFINLPPQMRNSTSAQKPFRCNVHHIEHPGLDGFAFEILEETTFSTGWCIWAGEACRFNRLVDFVAIKARQRYQFIILGLMLETPSRVFEHRASASILDSRMVILGRKDTRRQMGSFEQLVRPFHAGAWGVLIGAVALFAAVAAAIACAYSSSGLNLITLFFIYRGERAVDLPCEAVPELCAVQNVRNMDLARADLGKRCGGCHDVNRNVHANASAQHDVESGVAPGNANANANANAGDELNASRRKDDDDDKNNNGNSSSNNNSENTRLDANASVDTDAEAEARLRTFENSDSGGAGTEDLRSSMSTTLMLKRNSERARLHSARSQGNSGANAANIEAVAENEEVSRVTSRYWVIIGLYRVAVFAFTAIFLLFYEAAVVNFIFQQSAAKLDKELQLLTKNELQKYAVHIDTALEDVWHATIDHDGTRFKHGAYPWKQCVTSSECFEWMLDRKKNVTYMVTFDVLGRYLVNKYGAHKDVTKYETTTELFAFNGGWMYNLAVHPKNRTALDKQILTMKKNDKIRKIAEVEAGPEIEAGRPDNSIQPGTVLIPIGIFVGGPIALMLLVAYKRNFLGAKKIRTRRPQMAQNLRKRK